MQPHILPPPTPPPCDTHVHTHTQTHTKKQSLKHLNLAPPTPPTSYSPPPTHTHACTNTCTYTHACTRRQMHMHRNTFLWLSLLLWAVAAKVAQRRHSLLGNQVSVKMLQLKPMYRDKLLFQNVSENTSTYCLSLHLESVTGLKPQEILYGEKAGTVLVTFSDAVSKWDIMVC